MELEAIKKVHFIGIGGIGMSALAQLFLHAGKQVSGSDHSPSVVTDLLIARGATVTEFHAAENVTDGVDLVVYSDAIPEDHPERREAVQRGIRNMNYAQALGAVANHYWLIVIAGTAGKTTTTAMIADVLEAGGFDPTVVVGSLRVKTKSNFRAGQSKYFVVEGDEYRRHFLAFRPSAVVITNIEADHLDYYRDLADIESAFRELALRVPEDGVIVADPRSESVKRVVADARGKVVDYRPFINPLVPLRVGGIHNYQNAGAALALANFLGIEKTVAEKALADFAGTWRRFEHLGTLANGAEVYDDYAHHPTKVRAALRAAREKFPNKKILVAFHPHTFSRTKQFLGDFAKAFEDADRVAVAPIFAAREKDDGSISNKTLADAIAKHGTPAEALDSLEAAEGFFLKNSDANTVLFTMGAGDIYKVAEKLTRGQK